MTHSRSLFHMFLTSFMLVTSLLLLSACGTKPAELTLPEAESHSVSE
ncbi:hypothetical protein [Reinekea thalattae]|nr:hypothetical protein [Reinekea thalattae]